jgi:hypothetical protein
MPTGPCSAIDVVPHPRRQTTRAKRASGVDVDTREKLEITEDPDTDPRFF